MMLEGKVALISGASRGIGQAIARLIGQQGATTIGTATSEAGAEAISEHFKEHNIEGFGLVLDIGDEDSVKNCLAKIIEKYQSPTILINNAAINRDNLMLRMKDDEWLDVINTNLNGIFRLTRACIKGMVKQRYGRIITISSLVGLSGNPGQANYAAAKAGIIGFSKSLAQEVATRNITVNVVAPGLIETDMSAKLDEKQYNALLNKIPLQRLGTVEEIAHGVLYLASPNASYITGETLNINGGMYMH